MKPRPPQLDLFAGDPAHASPARRAVAPATRPPEVREASRQLPPGLRMGTSSWSFPGWAGLVYDGAFTQQRLARDGLTAYARHPLLRTVCVDRTHYAPASPDFLADYAAQVPDDFRFVVKAHEACTLAQFPPHRRYGASRGQPNRLFLDPGHAVDATIAPVIEGLGDRAGPILFQFAPQPVDRLGGPLGFADRLHRFLFALPPGARYAVEVRNRALVTPRYAAALADVGASHCVGLMPGMPDAETQWRVTAGATAPPALVVRWMLAPHLTYDEAGERYGPFGALVEEDPGTRAALARIVRDADSRATPAYVIVDNKAEGSAPLSIERLAVAIRAAGAPATPAAPVSPT